MPNIDLKTFTIVKNFYFSKENLCVFTPLSLIGELKIYLPNVTNNDINLLKQFSCRITNILKY
jgi:hypothetical protein